jgi:hypothetical protein
MDDIYLFTARDGKELQCDEHVKKEFPHARSGTKTLPEGDIGDSVDTISAVRLVFPIPVGDEVYVVTPHCEYFSHLSYENL